MSVEREVLEAACEEYLAGLRCTLWGQAFAITRAEWRQDAVRWLADQIEGVTAVVGEQVRKNAPADTCGHCGQDAGVHLWWCPVLALEQRGCQLDTGEDGNCPVHEDCRSGRRRG